MENPTLHTRPTLFSFTLTLSTLSHIQTLDSLHSTVPTSHAKSPSVVASTRRPPHTGLIIGFSSHSESLFWKSRYPLTLSLFCVLGFENSESMFCSNNIRSRCLFFSSFNVLYVNKVRVLKKSITHMLGYLC